MRSFHSGYMCVVQATLSTGKIVGMLNTSGYPVHGITGNTSFLPVKAVFCLQDKGTAHAEEVGHSHVNSTRISIIALMHELRQLARPMPVE